MARVRTLFCELKQNNISDKIKPQYNETNWPLYRSTCSLRVKNKDRNEHVKTSWVSW